MKLPRPVRLVRALDLEGNAAVGANEGFLSENKNSTFGRAKRYDKTLYHKGSEPGWHVKYPFVHQEFCEIGFEALSIRTFGRAEIH